jgi:hypothetical protein
MVFQLIGLELAVAVGDLHLGQVLASAFSAGGAGNHADIRQN